MRNAVAGNIRPDVVVYCLEALKYFEESGRTKANAVTMEIAMLGRSGLDINDPAQKYTLRSLPGKFSGMRLVQCIHGLTVNLLDYQADFWQKLADGRRFIGSRPQPWSGRPELVSAVDRRSSTMESQTTGARIV
jgi:hypothetical protein